MRNSIIKAAIVAALWLQQGFQNVQARSVPDISHLVGRDPDDGPITLKCSPPQHPLALLLRDGESNLTRRVMTLPDGIDHNSMDDFMQSEMSSTTPIVWRDQNSNDQNTAIYQLFAGAAVSAGLAGLCGCTTLVILSRTGWYATHYWESISFDPDEKWQFTDATDALQRSVLDPLNNGVAGVHPSLTAARGAFADDSVRAFIVKPSRAFNGDRAGYRTAWDEIKHTVGNIVPDLNPTQHNDRWQEVTYRRLDQNNPLFFSSAAGHVLLKYDPDHPAGTRRNKLTMWVEWDQVYNDAW